MRFKKILVIITILLLLFLAGCDKTNTKDSTGSSSGSQFVGGTSGLAIAFVSGTPPKEVLDSNQAFGISIKLSNKGDHDIKDYSKVSVKIAGFDPTDFGVTASDLEQAPAEELLGAKKDSSGNPVQGSIVTLDFPKSGSSLSHKSKIAGSVKYKIKADVCYPYQSIANAKLCVLEDILGTKSSATPLCKVNEKKIVDKSGGPVSVSSFVESIASSSKVAFVFKISHDGKGQLSESGSKCDQNFNKKNKVYVKVDTGISDGLTCSGLQNGKVSGSVYEGTATLLNKAREIRCTQTITTPKDFEKLVRIDLKYDYSETTSTELLVKHVGS